MMTRWNNVELKCEVGTNTACDQAYTGSWTGTHSRSGSFRNPRREPHTGPPDLTASLLPGAFADRSRSEIMSRYPAEPHSK